ncbi:MAG: V-type ATP synthase subunit E, partial [Oscillospiraceae bacterium]
MNGIEKLTQQISADAQAEIDALMADAKAKADAVTADYAQRAQKAAADVLAKGETAAAQREERLLSMAAMEGRKELLAAKQDMVGKAFDLALDKLCALPDQEYVELLAKLAVAASTTGKEQLIFSQKDRTRVGKAVVTAVNAALPNGSLTLSEQTRPMRGGFILSDGDVEVNCAFETLVRLQRGAISGDVADVLFA